MGELWFRGRLILSEDWNGLTAGTVVLWRDGYPKKDDDFEDLMALAESDTKGMPLRFDVAIMKAREK